MKALYTVCVFCLCLIALSPAVIQAAPDQEIQSWGVIIGKVVEVSSGETFKMVSSENREIEVWLAEIKAPEKGSAHGDASRKELEGIVLGNEVTVKVVSIRNMENGNGYVIAQVYLGGRWVNREMVAAGWAWHAPLYFQSEELAEAEQHAWDWKLGVWADVNAE